MSMIVWILVIGGSIALGAAVFYVLTRKRVGTPHAEQGMLMLQSQLAELVRTMDQKLGTVDQKLSESNRSMQEHMQHQFGESTKIIRDVTERLTKLDETNRQVLGF